jgi:hypothetical protein
MGPPLVRLARVAAFSLVVGACSQASITCIPDGAGIEPAGSKWSGASAPPTSIDLYLDASGSMIGFLPDELKKPPRQPRKESQAIRAQVTYETVLRGIHEFLDNVAPPGKGKDYYRVFAFDTKFCDLPNFNFDQPLKADFFNGSKVACKKSDNSRTDLGPTLSNIQKEHVTYRGNQAIGDPDRFSIILTDLILPGKGQPGDIPEDFRPADTIIRSGLAVAVLGIRVPFNGPLLDVPNRPAFTGYLPLYMVIVGAPDRISYFVDKLRAETLKSEWKGDRWNPEMVQYHLFMRDRVQTGGLDGVLRANARNVEQSPKPLISSEATTVRSFLISAQTQSADLVPAEGSAGLAPMPQGTWPLDMDVKARTWVFEAEGSPCAAGWKSFPKEPLRAEMRTRENALRISGFDNPGIVSDLTYVTHLESIFRKGGEPQWPPSWRADWSLDDAKDATKHLGEIQFPTLNLRTVLYTLERSAISSSTLEQPQALKFNMAFRKKET